MVADLSAISMDPADAFEAVGNSRRRQALLALDRAGDQVAAGDLAVQIGAIEHGVEPTEIAGDDRTSVYVTLVRNHLPRLDELGAIRYDDRAKLAAPSENTAPLAEYIRHLQSACYRPNGTATDDGDGMEATDG